VIAFAVPRSSRRAVSYEQRRIADERFEGVGGNICSDVAGEEHRHREGSDRLLKEGKLDFETVLTGERVWHGHYLRDLARAWVLDRHGTERRRPRRGVGNRKSEEGQEV
jgi:hypothetical protein